MTQPTTTQPTTIEEAQRRIDSIRAALISGAGKIKPSDLAEAKDELEFAQLRAEAKRYADEKAAIASRRANLLELQKKLQTVSDSRKTVDAKFAEFGKSLMAYLGSCSDYQNELNDIRNSLQANGLYPGATVVVGGATQAHDIVPGIEVTDIRRELTIGTESATNVLPDQEIKPLIERALGEYNRNF